MKDANTTNPSVSPMLRWISRLALGLCAVVIPGLGISIALVFTLSGEMIAYVVVLAMLAINLGVAAWLSWACVRYGRMSQNVAASLPALPFAAMVLLSTPALFFGSFLPALFWLVPFLVALATGWRAARFAKEGSSEVAQHAE